MKETPGFVGEVLIYVCYVDLHLIIALLLHQHSWFSVLADMRHLQKFTEIGVVTTNQISVSGTVYSIQWQSKCTIYCIYL